MFTKSGIRLKIIYLDSIFNALRFFGRFRSSHVKISKVERDREKQKKQSTEKKLTFTSADFVPGRQRHRAALLGSA